MGKYLDDARSLYQKALEELDQYEQTRDPLLLRQAAEKAWGALTQASNDLIDFFDRQVPHGTGARESNLHVIESSDRRLRRQYHLEERFQGLGSALHEHCFYDGDCPPQLTADRIREQVQEFLEDIEAITSQPRN